MSHNVSHAAERNDLEALEREIKTRSQTRDALAREAKSLAQTVQKLKKDIIAQARKLRKIDGERDRLEARIGELSSSEKQLSAQLLKDRHNLARALAALQVMEREPPPPFAVHPDDALKAVQGAIALAGVIPAMQVKARGIRAQLLELGAIRRRITERENALTIAQKTAEKTRIAMNKSLAAKALAEQAARRKTRAEEEKIAKLVRDARNLKDLLAKLAEQERQRAARTPAPASKTRAFAKARGLLPLPVNGQITRRYGKRQTNGQITHGITITARTGAQITAPYDGRILYAGPFRQYGGIVILDIVGGYQIVLTGLGRTQSYVGQNVLAGEPVGTLPAANKPVLTSIQKNNATDEKINIVKRDLYLELRHKGRPIDPTPWIARKRKGNT